MSLSRRAFERLIILNTAIWIVVLMLGVSLLERSRDSIAAYLAPIGSELGGWTGLLLGEAAPGAEPLPVYALEIAPRVLRAAELGNPRTGTIRDRDELPWFPARFRAGSNAFDVQAQLAPGAQHGRSFEARAWRVRFEEEAAQHGVRELVLTPAGLNEQASALLARQFARELGLVSPPGGFAALQINGVSAGTFFWSETISASTFARLGVPSGEILTPVGGAARLPRELVGPAREVLAPAEYTLTTQRATAAGLAPEKLRRLLSLTRRSDDASFAAEVPQLLNVERYLTWNALAWLFGSSDADAFLELAWYFDPVTGLLEPSVERLGSAPQPTDVAHFDAEDASRLSDRLLGIPRYRQQRNEILWKLVGDPDHDIVEQADARLGSLLVRLARAPGSFPRLHELSRVRRHSRETLQDNASAFRAALVAGSVDATPKLSRPGQPARVTLELVPHGLADILLTEIRFDVGSLGFGREGEARLTVRDPAGQEVLRTRLVPEISGTTVVLRPEPVVLRPADLRRADSGELAWQAELSLPFFPASDWARPGFLERIELGYRNTITGRALPPGHLFFAPEPERDASGGAVADAATLRRSLARSGLPFEVRGDQLVLPAGAYTLSETLMVPAAYRLRLEPGVRLALAQGVSIHTLRGLVAEGRADAPIEIFAAQAGKPWGAVAVARASEASSLRFVRIAGGSQATLDGIDFTSQMAFHAADAILRDVEVREGLADGLSLQRSRFDIAHSRFLDNAGDGVDVGWSQGSISDSLFANNGDDGFDMGTSEASVQHSEFRAMADKGISVGERSRATITDCALLDSAIGIASKEDSRAAIAGSDFRGNRVGLAVYRDNASYGGGFASVRGGSFAANVTDLDVAPGSELELSGVKRERENTIARSFGVFLSSLAASGSR